MQKSYIRIVTKTVGTVERERERERERVTFYKNGQEKNKIKKERVGLNSTLKNIYKNKKEDIMLED